MCISICFCKVIVFISLGQYDLELSKFTSSEINMFSHHFMKGFKCTVLLKRHLTTF